MDNIGHFSKSLQIPFTSGVNLLTVVLEDSNVLFSIPSWPPGFDPNSDVILLPSLCHDWKLPRNYGVLVERRQITDLKCPRPVPGLVWVQGCRGWGLTGRGRAWTKEGRLEETYLLWKITIFLLHGSLM
ncbi:hypothetical protein CEXT_423791 [Caerostris extrusa]|uniref:Uncharacterized protein n=1 Tax=Caerostris extrusa TaxID=172846 RepID=A0AAV4Y098_CAEEX|nr:hypothetical protein CEXT_423791 [Caerostris extrusa]